MEIGDILIYILGGIFLLGGLLRKRKKTAQQQQVFQDEELEAEPVFSGQGVQDFDDWLMGKETVVQSKPIPVMPEKKVVKNQNADIFSSSRVREKAVPQAKPQNISGLMVHNNNNNLNIELNTAEDARRAFIYSEIFQRRY